MTADKSPFFNYQALMQGALILAALTLIMIGLALVLNVRQATAPQLLTLSALWIVPGIRSALQVPDGRLLQGMVTGVVGALLVVVLSQFLLYLVSQSMLLNQLAGRAAIMVVILGGLWGAIGGLFAEIIQLRRNKRASRRPQAK